MKIHSVVYWDETPCSLYLGTNASQAQPGFSSGYQSLQISVSAKWFVRQHMLCPADAAPLPPPQPIKNEHFMTLIENIEILLRFSK
jgi:hypothetical protein